VTAHAAAITPAIAPAAAATVPPPAAAAITASIASAAIVTLAAQAAAIAPATTPAAAATAANSRATSVLSLLNERSESGVCHDALHGHRDGARRRGGCLRGNEDEGGQACGQQNKGFHCVVHERAPVVLLLHGAGRVTLSRPVALQGYSPECERCLNTSSSCFDLGCRSILTLTRTCTASCGTA